MTSKIPGVLMSNGRKMPLVGLGTFQGQEDEMKRTLNAALEMGYRHIDTAALYQNEAEIGDVLHEWISTGRVKREELFVVTKLPMIGNRAKDVDRFIQKSLDRLRLSYLDLYLIHNPVGMVGKDDDDVWPKDENGYFILDKETNLEELYKGMEGLVDSGKTKAIGLSNFNSKQIERIMKVCRIKPANLQVEAHVYHQQKELRQICRSYGITVCAYGPIGAPYRTTENENDSVPILLQHPVVTSIASRHGKTPAQVLLKFLVQNKVAVIPKTVKKERLKENMDLFDFELSKDDLKALEALDRGRDGRVLDFTKIFIGMETHHEWAFNIPY